MCIYFIADLIMFLFVLLSFSPMSTEAHPRRNITETRLQARRNRMLLVSCVMLALIWGLRSYSVGNDTSEYANFIKGINGYFGNLSSPREDMEPGFLGIMSVVLFFSQNPTIVFCLQTFCLFGVVYKLYKSVNPENATWCVLLYFVLNWNFITLVSVAFRQAISTTVFLYGVYLMEKNIGIVRQSNKKIYKNKAFILPLLVILFSATVHKATLVLMPFLLLAFVVKISKKISCLLILSTLIISLFFSNIISQTFDWLMISFGDSNSDVLNHMSHYSETLGDGINTLTSSLLRTFMYLSMVYYADKDNVGSVYFNVLVMAACFFNIFSASNQIGRLLFPLTMLCGCLYIPSVTQRKWIPRILFLSFTLLYMYRAYSAFSTWTSVNRTDTTLPYYFFWEK